MNNLIQTIRTKFPSWLFFIFFAIIYLTFGQIVRIILPSTLEWLYLPIGVILAIIFHRVIYKIESGKPNGQIGKHATNKTMEPVNFSSNTALHIHEDDPCGFSTLKRVMDNDVDRLGGTYNILFYVLRGLDNHCRDFLRAFKNNRYTIDGKEEFAINRVTYTNREGIIELELGKGATKELLTAITKDDENTFDWDFEEMFSFFIQSTERFIAQEGVGSNGIEINVTEDAEDTTVAYGFRALLAYFFEKQVRFERITIDRVDCEPYVVTMEDCDVFEQWLSDVFEEETDIEDLLHRVIEIELV